MSADPFMFGGQRFYDGVVFFDPEPDLGVVAVEVFF